MQIIFRSFWTDDLKDEESLWYTGFPVIFCSINFGFSSLENIYSLPKAILLVKVLKYLLKIIVPLMITV